MSLEIPVALVCDFFFLLSISTREDNIFPVSLENNVVDTGRLVVYKTYIRKVGKE